MQCALCAFSKFVGMRVRRTRGQDGDKEVKKWSGSGLKNGVGSQDWGSVYTKTQICVKENRKVKRGLQHKNKRNRRRKRKWRESVRRKREINGRITREGRYRRKNKEERGRFIFHLLSSPGGPSDLEGCRMGS